MKKFFIKSLMIAMTLFVVAVFFATLSENTVTTAISLNELADKVGRGEIEKIEVSDQSIVAKTKSGEEITSRNENGSGILETLGRYGATPEQLRAVKLEIKDNTAKDTLLGIIIPMLIPIIAIGIIFVFLMKKATSGSGQAFTFGKANVKAFADFKNKISFKDVAGLKEAKQELEEIVDFLKSPKKYEALGAKIPKGVLLMGAPGTGKTLLARAVAGEAGVPFFHISASEFVEMFVGVGASRTRDAFNTAKQAAPSILFIDEIDAVGRERGSGLGGGHDEREQTLNQILVEMDGFEKGQNVIVLAATNRPDVLDSALLRPGRFDRRVTLDLPDIAEREEILDLHAKNKPLAKDTDLRRIAIRTPGFSGADLQNLLNEAAILTAQKNEKEVTQESIYDSIEKVILGPARRSRIISEREKKITAYHEAGHALVAAIEPDADPVRKVSIISRGRAGGYTMQLPSEELRLKTKKQFTADLKVLLGGYAAEEELTGDVSTGPSSDLRRATEIAKNAVTRYGMSDKLGPQTFGNTDEAIFLGREITTDKDYSEETARTIDAEVSKMISEAHEGARKIIRENKNPLDKLAAALLERETLEQEEFYEILEKEGLKLKQD